MSARRILRHCSSLLLLVAAAGSGAAGGLPERAPKVAEVTIHRAKRRSDTRMLVPGEFVPIAYDRPLFYLYRGGTDLLIEQKGQVFSVSIDGGPARLAGVRVSKGPIVAGPLMRKRLAQARELLGMAEDEIDGTAALKDAIARRVTPLTITCDADALDALPAIPQGMDVALVAQGDDLAALPAFIARCPSLSALSVYAEKWVPDTELFRSLRGLTSLSLELLSAQELDRAGDEGIMEVKDLAPVGELTHLKVLTLRWRFAAKDLKPLSKLTDLVSLTLDAPARDGDLSPLSALTSLEWLSLGRPWGVRHLAALPPLKHLKILSLFGCDALEDISALGELESLRELNIYAPDVKSRIANLPPLARLKNLRGLSIHGLIGLRDLRPLANLRRLTSLGIRQCGNAKDLTPLRRFVKRGGQLSLDGNAKHEKVRQLREGADF